MHLFPRRFQQRHEAIDIDAGATADQHGQQQVAGAVDRCFQLGVAAVSDRLPAFCAGMTAADVVEAASPTVQSGRVEGGSADAAAAWLEASDGGGEEATCSGGAEQASAGLLQCGEVRQLAQAEDGT
jgi:hypothetical protein